MNSDGQPLELPVYTEDELDGMDKSDLKSEIALLEGMFGLSYAT